MIKVFNLCSPSSGRKIANQFQLTTNKGYIFQSYESLCACEYQGKDYINKRYYKCSATTSKYMAVFFNCDSAKEMHQRVKSGHIKVISNEKFIKIIMNRILISKTPEFIGKKIKIAGWVNARRDHGKLVFIDLRDRSGIIQTVIIPDKKEAYETAGEIRSEFAIEMEGLIKERPSGAVNEKDTIGGVEMEVEGIKILSRVEDGLPVDVSEKEMDLNLETLLNYRSLTLRNEKINSIFKIYSEILKSYNEFMRKEGFLEIKTPKILSMATEGGANFFKIKYFDRDAYLAQSPQFYKQAGVGIFERVFEVGTVFRAEPHFTTRHVNEYVSLDAEFGFIDSFEDIMSQLEKTVAFMLNSVNKNCKNELEKYGLLKREKGTGKVYPTELTFYFKSLIKEIEKQVKSNLSTMLPKIIN